MSRFAAALLACRMFSLYFLLETIVDISQFAQIWLLVESSDDTTKFDGFLDTAGIEVVTNFVLAVSLFALSRPLAHHLSKGAESSNYTDVAGRLPDITWRVFAIQMLGLFLLFQALSVHAWAKITETSAQGMFETATSAMIILFVGKLLMSVALIIFARRAERLLFSL